MFLSGPSAYHKDQWVGYDDRESVFAKGEYILKNGFGGATLWTADLDDFLNHCCTESFPLLKSINRALGSYFDSVMAEQSRQYLFCTTFF